MSKKKHNLIISAHPDDETLFFAGLVLKKRQNPWHVICVTDGGADGKGPERQSHFLAACEALGVQQTTFLNLPDRFEQRLDVWQVRSLLEDLPSPNQVFTHGPLGEYGHPHHQDISMAVHERFAKKAPVFSVAHNCLPDLTISLDKKTYTQKAEILSKIYFSETERFIHFVPATTTESFVRLSLKEVRAIYDFFAFDKTIGNSDLIKYKWFLPYFSSFKKRTRNRPF